MATIATADWMEGDVLPLAAKVERRGWVDWDDAPVDRDAFEISLREDGVPANEIEEVLVLRDEYIALAERYHALDDPRLGKPPSLRRYGGEGGDESPPFMKDVRAARWRLIDWMQGRGFEGESSELVEVRIPLFALAAADVEGCTAKLAVAEHRSKWVIDWGIKVFGPGLSGTVGFTVSSTASFSAAHGETKVIFLPVSFTVESGTVTKHGKVVGTARRAEMFSVKSGALGLLLLEKGKEPPIGDLVQSYPLAGDTSGAVATYEYTAEKAASRKMSLGAKVFGAELSIGTEITRNNQMVLTYGLRGGSDYELHRVTDGDGLVWKPLAVTTSSVAGFARASTPGRATSHCEVAGSSDHRCCCKSCSVRPESVRRRTAPTRESRGSRHPAAGQSRAEGTSRGRRCRAGDFGHI